MKKLIQFEKDEFEMLLQKFVDNIIAQQDKSYGISIVFNETG